MSTLDTVVEADRVLPKASKLSVGRGGVRGVWKR